MKIPLFHVDAFSSRAFGGNPAAVCILDAWPETELLQSIAAENYLPETAFIVPAAGGQYELRWFTPTVEVDLCGHATLASAFVLFVHLDRDEEALRFQTASGELSVSRADGLLSLDFPSREPTEAEPPRGLAEALGAEPGSVLEARDLLAVFQDEATIRGMAPDFERLKSIESHFAVIVTAPGKNSDFVSRFFAPNAGIDEDPVTGSAHCSLIPYWAKRLGKERLHAFQLSQRGGELFCQYRGDRVGISGRATLFARGEINI